MLDDYREIRLASSPVAQTCVLCRSAALKETSLHDLNGKAADPGEAGSALQ